MSAHRFSSSAFQQGVTDLLNMGAIDGAQSQILLTEHRQTGKALEDLCVDLRFLSPRSVGQLMSLVKGHEEAPLRDMILDAALIQRFPRALCMQHTLIPLCEKDAELWIAMANVDDLVVRDRVSQLFPQQKLKFFWASHREIVEAIERYYGFEMTLAGLLREMETTPPHSYPSDSWVHPVVRFVQALLVDAVQKGSSDIHFEPEEALIRIRYRCDGLLKTTFLFHQEHWPHVLNRFKIIAHMDIAETRRPQNGRLTSHLLGRAVDFRLATHPTVKGETLVVRVLDQAGTPLKLDCLGYPEEVWKKMAHCLKQPSGLVVATGPTGSGKTTTLYSFLTHLECKKRKIMTLEEPVEYQLPFISQTDLQEALGLTFATGVKSLLRQDPDVIFIGEIRDADAAHMALRAAMTGHQVFTTLHTPDALSGVYRLMELGVRSTLLAAHINGVVSQRLVRQLCLSCKKPVLPPAFLQPPRATCIFEASGCADCEGTGYKNRVPLAEVLLFDEALNAWLLEGAHRPAVAPLLQKQGFKTLWEEGMAAVFQGMTDLQELERVLGPLPFFR